MSILIKGMEMPKSCWLCPLSVLYKKPREMLFCRITKEEVLRNKVDGNCPLVEVPTPHGRLIDADALKEKMKIVTRTAVQEIIEYDINAYKVDDAPTVIESEEA